MSIRRSLTLLLLAVLGITAGCAPQPTIENEPELERLTVGLTYQPDIQFAMFYVADALGYFTDAGMDITIRHHGSSESLFGALEAGTEDVVFAGGDEMLQARSQGTDVVNFATMYQTHPVVLIVPADSPIQHPADLRGHSVGIPGPYGENYFGLLALLQRANLTESDVDVQNIGYTLQAALQGDRVDAVVGFSNNDAVRFKAAGFEVRTISITESELTPLVGAGLGASSATLAAHETGLTAMMKAVRKATQYCIDNPAEAVRIAQDYVPGLNDPEQQEKSLQTLQATIPLYDAAAGIGRQDEAKWAAMVDFMSSAGLLGGEVTATDAFTTKIA